MSRTDRSERDRDGPMDFEYTTNRRINPPAWASGSSGHSRRMNEAPMDFDFAPSPYAVPPGSSPFLIKARDQTTPEQSKEGELNSFARCPAPMLKGT